MKDILNHKDVRTAQAAKAVFKGAEKLISKTKGDVNKLLFLENKMAEKPGKYTTMMHLCIKAAISKVKIMSLKKSHHIEIVVPMYHEIIRMSPRATSTEKLLANSFKPHINGEDSILRKYLELNWLTKNSNVTFKLILVDDICDQKSGEYAKRLVDENKLKNCEVYFLSDAIENAKANSFLTHALETIISEGDSIRAGALCLGFAKSVLSTKSKGTEENTLIGYVDADSSYSLTQLGIPVWEMVQDPKIAAMTASRQHKLTFMEPAKTISQTSQRSPGLIRLKQVVGYLRRSILGNEVPADTQSGFKLFRPDVIENTLNQPKKAHNFSYDTQLLSRIIRLYPDRKICTFGVVCIDCDELSTANTDITYFYALQILLTLSEEIGLDKKDSKMWLLNFLATDINNYKMAITLLEDSTNISNWISEDCERLHNLLTSLRGQIKTDRDTTAVGEYFTENICDELVQIFKAIENQDNLEADFDYLPLVSIA